MRWQSEFGGNLFRMIAHRADQDVAQTEGLDRNRGILGSEGGIDDPDDKRLEIIEAFEPDLPLLGGAAQSCEINAPDQVQRALHDMLLARCQFREPRLPRRVFDCNDAPG